MLLNFFGMTRKLLLSQEHPSVWHNNCDVKKLPLLLLLLVQSFKRLQNDHSSELLIYGPHFKNSFLHKVESILGKILQVYCSSLIGI